MATVALNCFKMLENAVVAKRYKIAYNSLHSFTRTQNKESLECVIEHPGFEASCLNRWSLELAAGNYKTLDGHRYGQIGSKER